jgi:hypothetical protein
MGGQKQRILVPTDLPSEAPDAKSRVLAYIKPDIAADDGNIFLTLDGQTHDKSVEESKKIIEELTAGKNPPPSLDSHWCCVKATFTENRDSHLFRK